MAHGRRTSNAALFTCRRVTAAPRARRIAPGGNASSPTETALGERRRGSHVFPGARGAALRCGISRRVTRSAKRRCSCAFARLCSGIRRARQQRRRRRSRIVHSLCTVRLPRSRRAPCIDGCVGTTRARLGDELHRSVCPSPGVAMQPSLRRVIGTWGRVQHVLRRHETCVPQSAPVGVEPRAAGDCSAEPAGTLLERTRTLCASPQREAAVLCGHLRTGPLDGW